MEAYKTRVDRTIFQVQSVDQKQILPMYLGYET